ncbi:hypothetical protein SBA1_1310015 [Candidatus Sulfotelmatobacter kueseliae]|uniref:Uncharacterized protein n=1 Tax=Candidatus Sulfotelmatobacter kueseliae TaxID=2042962 RepID=A0A2U3K4I0_9BACT|nr:hypothetical protein SBA1_1310015 [Candidatus Sulfotelmatobacter kueseliae]
MKWMALGAESDLASPVRPEVHQAATRYACSSLMIFSAPWEKLVGFIVATPLNCPNYTTTNVAATGQYLGHSNLGRNPSLLLDLCDLGTQPVGQCLFQFDLTSGAIEVIHGLPLFRQLDKAAGYALTPERFGDKLFQQASLTGVRPRRIAEIRADRRVLKNRGSAPR